MKSSVFSLFYLVVVLMVTGDSGCTPKTQENAAAAAYAAELQRCVAISATLEESKACRADVDKRWGVK